MPLLIPDNPKESYVFETSVGMYFVSAVVQTFLIFRVPGRNPSHHVVLTTDLFISITLLQSRYR